MIDFNSQITNFLKENFKPCTISEGPEDLHFTSAGLLEMLFSVFPDGCIDDYELHTILTTLGYTPQKRAVNEIVWCLAPL